MKKTGFTGVLIQDPQNGTFTAYVAEFPEAVTQAPTADEAKERLKESLNLMMNFRREEALSEAESQNVEMYQFAM